MSNEQPSEQDSASTDTSPSLLDKLRSQRGTDEQMSTGEFLLMVGAVFIAFITVIGAIFFTPFGGVGGGPGAETDTTEPANASSENTTSSDNESESLSSLGAANTTESEPQHNTSDSRDTDSEDGEDEPQDNQTSGNESSSRNPEDMTDTNDDSETPEVIIGGSSDDDTNTTENVTSNETADERGASNNSDPANDSVPEVNLPDPNGSDESAPVDSTPRVGENGTDQSDSTDHMSPNETTEDDPLVEVGSGGEDDPLPEPAAPVIPEVHFDLNPENVSEDGDVVEVDVSPDENDTG